jgi:hypothetical protein
MMQKSVPRAGLYCSDIWAMLGILFLILAAGCSSGSRCAPGEPAPKRRVYCTNEDHLTVTQVIAPYTLIPDSPGCTVQLLVRPDRTEYHSGDTITIITMLKLHGNCVLHIFKTDPMREFYPIVITNEKGENALLTEEGQRLKELAESGGVETEGWVGDKLTNEHNACARLAIDEWFDLSAPGIYTLTLRHSLNQLSEGVVGNTVTFTRVP